MEMLRSLVAAFVALLPISVYAAGTIPLALSQQVDVNGKPLIGALLYTYVVGTVATPQSTFIDSGLATANPFPLVADSSGRIPMFFLADGSVHVRLTDANGIVLIDVPQMLVIGPSGGGGGGSTVDPTTIASTGDIKFRPTGESLTGWVRLNGLTIGSAISGATGRANADTQNLFVYLWGLCPDPHCPVVGGRGSSALSDFNANKQITLMDLRSRMIAGVDDMGNVAAGRNVAGNVTSGGGDGVTTPNATGGFSTQTLLTTNLPPYTPSGSISGSVSISGSTIGGTFGFNPGGDAGTISPQSPSPSFSGNFTGNAQGGVSAALNTMNPFILGSWHVKL